MAGELDQLEFERALLGAVLRGYRGLHELTRIVTGADFYDSQHEGIWRAALELHQDGQLVNPLTVLHHLGKEAHRLPGGATYLSDLDAPVIAQAPFYAMKVRDQSIRRQVDALGTRCKQVITDPDKTPEELVSQIRAWADGVGSQTAREVSGISEALETVIDIAQHGQPKGQPTPWPGLTALIDGWFPGQLVTIGARPGVGKSIALENIGTAAARGGDWVLFVSLEMSPEELTQRTMAHTAGVELTKLRRGKDALSDADWRNITKAAGIIDRTPMRFADQPVQTMSSIRAASFDVSQEAKRNGARLGMIVVDYVQLITSTGGSRTETRQQQIGTFTRGLKQMAREFDCPVITAAQLNRAPMARAHPEPVMSDLREAGDIEQDSNVVILLHEETVMDGDTAVPTGDVRLIVAKNRNGPRGMTMVKKYGHLARMHDPSTSLRAIGAA